MSLVEDSLNNVLENYYPNYKDFWGPANKLSIGTGLVFSEINYPLLNLESGFFQTVQGPILVLTHECDISQENERYFNEELLICPIIPFEEFINQYVSYVSQDALQSNFIPSLSKHKISRVMYLPYVNEELLPYGGLIYFNQISSTHISMFEKKKAAVAISAPGLNCLSLKLQNHLLRPKAEILPLTQWYYPSLFR